jgi:hypothetical protein
MIQLTSPQILKKSLEAGDFFFSLYHYEKTVRIQLADAFASSVQHSPDSSPTGQKLLAKGWGDL